MHGAVVEISGGSCTRLALALLPQAPACLQMNAQLCAILRCPQVHQGSAGEGKQDQSSSNYKAAREASPFQASRGVGRGGPVPLPCGWRVPARVTLQMHCPPCARAQSPWHEDHWGLRAQWRFRADCSEEWCRDVPQDWWGRCGADAQQRWRGCVHAAFHVRARACSPQPGRKGCTCRAIKEWHRVPLAGPEAPEAPSPQQPATTLGARWWVPPTAAQYSARQLSLAATTLLLLASAALAAWALRRQRAAAPRPAVCGKVELAEM